MKVALVHDYLFEFGGAERVLLALSEIWPEAPIYTAFYSKKSSAGKRFMGKDIRVSWFHFLPFPSKLASPLRFLAPLIWNSFNFSEYDVVISSANWYVTKGVKKGNRTIEICYCHTPPRYLYGYRTSVEWQKYWAVWLYGMFVGHFLRLYDYRAAQKVDYFLANSKNVAKRIEKFYRRDSKVIYPPVEIKKQDTMPKDHTNGRAGGQARRKKQERGDYYLVVSRIVGGKGLELAVEAANKLQIPLKIVGRTAGWGSAGRRTRQMAGKTIEFLGEVEDEELWNLYAGAKAFLATAEEEDFGITPAEAMAAGTPVIAYKGGGYLESVVAGKTGVFFEDYSSDSLARAINKFNKMKFSEKECRLQAKRFSKERFKKEITEFVEGAVIK